jgi:hypothetical protein
VHGEELRTLLRIRFSIRCAAAHGSFALCSLLPQRPEYLESSEQTGRLLDEAANGGKRYDTHVKSGSGWKLWHNHKFMLSDDLIAHYSKPPEDATAIDFFRSLIEVSWQLLSAASWHADAGRSTSCRMSFRFLFLCHV